MILTSAEHLFWNTPRRVRVLDSMRAEPPYTDFVLLEVPASEPDGPMWLVATSRYGNSWQTRPGMDIPVSIWQFADRPQLSPQDRERYRPPTERAQAWCTIQIEDEDEDDT